MHLIAPTVNQFFRLWVWKSVLCHKWENLENSLWLKIWKLLRAKYLWCHVPRTALTKQDVCGRLTWCSLRRRALSWMESPLPTPGCTMFLSSVCLFPSWVRIAAHTSMQHIRPCSSLVHSDHISMKLTCTCSPHIHATHMYMQLTHLWSSHVHAAPISTQPIHTCRLHPCCPHVYADCTYMQPTHTCRPHVHAAHTYMQSTCLPIHADHRSMQNTLRHSTHIHDVHSSM